MNMQRTEQDDPSRTRKPILLSIPNSKGNYKLSEKAMPTLLKVNIFAAKKERNTNIFRLPRDYHDTPKQISIERKAKVAAYLTVPKLIDIRSVLQSARKESNQSRKKVESPALKNIQLIKFPIIQSETPLLDPPKRTKYESPKHTVVDREEPQLIDVRPFTPQEPAKFIQTKIIKETKNKYLDSRQSSRSSQRRPSALSYSLKHDKENDDSSSMIDGFEYENAKIPKKKRHKKHCEDELYETISELLMERKKRKRHRKLRLFDIIDNIQISSDSDGSEDTDALLHQKVRIRKERKQDIALPNIVDPFIPVSRNLTTKVVVNEDNDKQKVLKRSMLPDVPLERFKPKSNKHIDELDKNNDPMSWASLIKTARQNAQSTQTEFEDSKMNTLGIQTEMSEMIDIPRTQTFFKSNEETGDINAKKTKEFCERVRKEVTEKLDNLNRKQDKVCQTVSSIAVQTEGAVNEIYSGCMVDTSSTPNAPNEKSHPLSLPPDIRAEVRFNCNAVASKNAFIDIVDVESHTMLEVLPESDISKKKFVEKFGVPIGFCQHKICDEKESEIHVDCLDNIHDSESRKQQSNTDQLLGHNRANMIENFAHTEAKLIPKVSGIDRIQEGSGELITTATPQVDLVPESHSNRKLVKKDSNLSAEVEVSASIGVLSNDGGNMKDEKDLVNISSRSAFISDLINGKKLKKTQHVYKQMVTKEISKQHVKSPVPLETTEKGKLKNKIAKFSVGLEALQDIQENLEKELQQSKCLFGLIDTLQDGFLHEECSENSLHNSTDLIECFSPHMKSDESREENEVNSIDVNGNGLGAGGGCSESQLFLEEINSCQDVEVATDVHSVSDAAHENISEGEFNEEYNEALFESLELSASNAFIGDYNENNFRRHPKESGGGGDFFSTSRLPKRFMSSLGVDFNVEDLESNKQENEKVLIETEQDKIFKEKIRKRISEGRKTPEEAVVKKDEDKRSKLLRWIQTKKMERQKAYLEDLGRKREAEHHPFISKNMVSTEEIKEKASIKAQMKRCVLEENNDERLLIAEKLASSIIEEERYTHSKSRSSSRPKARNNRYAQNNAIPIRETRSSKIRKTALMMDICKNQSLLQETIRSRKRRIKVDSVTIGNKKEQGKSKKRNANVKTSRRSKTLEKSFDAVNASGRISVEAHEFVTKDSYDEYMVKSNKLFRKTMKEYRQLDGEYIEQQQLVDSENISKEGADYPRRLTSSRLSTHREKDASFHFNNIVSDNNTLHHLSSNFSLSSAADNLEVKTLFTEYGVEVDDGLFEGASRTSQLLAEVDFALLDESKESVLDSENIDWNEIDRILEE